MTSAAPVPHDKFAGIDTLPMFDMEATPVARPETQRTTAPYARASCPSCANISAPLTSDGQHLRWRQHTLFRGTGPSTPCAASGQLLHDMMPRDGHYVLVFVRDGRPRRRPAECGCAA